MQVTIGLFSVLLLCGIPLAFAFGTAGLLGIWWSGLSFSVVPTRAITSIDSMTLLAAPFYILAGELMNSGGITDRLIALSTRIMGRVRGATAYANVLTSVFFSGISGSSVADTAALGKVFIHGMPREGYTKEYAAAVTLASALIGPIIPPSITAVIYAALTGVSVIGLFVAGIVPGLLLGLACMAVIWVGGLKGDLPAPRPVRPAAFRSGAWPLTVFSSPRFPALIVLGAVGGVFTPTEAGGVACLYAMALGAWAFRTLDRATFAAALRNAARSTAVVFFLVAMVSVASYVLIIEGLGSLSAVLQTGFSDRPYAFLFASVGMLLFLGLFLEPTVILLVFIPLLLPVARSLELDDFHFAMVVMLTLTVGMITPPVGINLFVAMSHREHPALSAPESALAVSGRRACRDRAGDLCPRRSRRVCRGFFGEEARVTACGRGRCRRQGEVTHPALACRVRLSCGGARQCPDRQVPTGSERLGRERNGRKRSVIAEVVKPVRKGDPFPTGDEHVGFAEER